MRKCETQEARVRPEDGFRGRNSLTLCGHGRFFSEILPANMLIEAGAPIGHYEVEIEVEAMLETK